MDPYDNKIYKKYFFLLKKKKLKENKKRRELKENTDKLIFIGTEMFNKFLHDKITIKNFLDICAAPGCYSKLVLERFPKSNGYGISLPVSENGVKFEIDNKNYSCNYKNILVDKIDIDKKFFFAIASCVPYDLSKMFSIKFQLKLIVTSIIIILKNLDSDGNIIINMTFKKMFPIYNLILILQKIFKKFVLWKSVNVWKFTKSFYFFGYGFKKSDAIFTVLQNYLLLIEDKNSDVYTKFCGTKEDYKKILQQFENMFNNLIKKYNSI